MVDDFKKLDDRNHCLLRPNMYVGAMVCEPQSGIINYRYSTKNIVPGLIKIIEEIFQNSIDEYVRTDGKFATNIDVSFASTLEGVEIAVSDDGRGIPLDLIENEPRAVLAWTSLRAGSNFDDSTRIGVGANGVGSALTNILSKSFIGTTSNGKDGIVVTCSDNMAKISHRLIKTSHRGTTVKFVPDLSKFGILDFDQDHLDVITDRLNNLAILYPGIQFSINKEKIKFKNIKQVAKNFSEFSVAGELPNISYVFAPSGSDEEFRLLSYINGIYIKNGGVHVDYFMNKIIENLRAHITKKHKIDVIPSQIRQHILFASWITKFPSCKFDSQSKERLTNSIAEVSKFLADVDFDKISKQILNTPEIIDPCIASILYKKEREEALALAKKQKEVSKKRIVNHIAATHPDPEQRTLFICEGLSAIGNLLSVRDSKIHAGYPLRGKPLNVRGMRPVEILKNKEISELLNIIGLEFGKPATDVNYGKIAIMVDADQDGAGAIQCLLLNLFSNWPELFSDGRIYRLMTPLYSCTKGKQVMNFYTKEEFDKFNSRGWEVSYLKGLGTMSKETYGKCINDPFLIKISANDTDFQKLEMSFGDSADKRKQWMLQ